MRRRRAALRVASAGCVTLAVALTSSAARADASFALTWRAEPGATACVTEGAVRDAVEKKLGRKPFTGHDHADIVIEGEELLTDGRFRARLTQRARSGAVLGSRELDAQTCADLIRTTAIVVALFIEPDKDREPGDRRPREAPIDDRPPDGARLRSEVRTEPMPGTRPRSGATPVPSELPPLASRRPFELSLGFGGATSVGLLPSASIGLRGVARLEHTGARWSFEWSGGYSLPQTLREGSVRGTFSAIDQQLRGCLALVAEPKLRLDTCGGGFWGAIVPSTVGVKDGNDAWRPVVGPMGALAVELRETTRALRLDVGLTALPVRRSLYYVTSAAEPARFYSTGRVIVFVGLSGLFTIL